MAGGATGSSQRTWKNGSNVWCLAHRPPLSNQAFIYWKCKLPLTCGQMVPCTGKFPKPSRVMSPLLSLKRKYSEENEKKQNNSLKALDTQVGCLTTARDSVHISVWKEAIKHLGKDGGARWECEAAPVKLMEWESRATSVALCRYNQLL